MRTWKWLKQRHYYYRRGGRLFDIQTTPGRFARLREEIEENK